MFHQDSSNWNLIEETNQKRIKELYFWIGYEIKQHTIQAEANRRIQEMITESNALLADEYAKYNEIVSSYIHIPAQAAGPVPDPTVSLTALSYNAKTQPGDGVVVAPTDDVIPVPVVLNN
jgi:hypothetical protein